MKEHKSNYIYGYDETQAVGKAYGATNTPQFFVLDKERKIRYTGAMDDNQRRGEGHQELPPRRGRTPCSRARAPPIEETRAVGCGIGVQEVIRAVPTTAGPGEHPCRSALRRGATRPLRRVRPRISVRRCPFPSSTASRYPR